MSASGDVVRAGINGRTYRVKGGTDLTRNPRIKREGMPTSGAPLFKQTFNMPSTDGLALIMDAVEYGLFEKMVNADIDMACWVEYQSGRISECTGRVAIDTWTSAENTCTVNILPATASGWSDSVS
jgi:hypothetical protein